MNKVIFLFIFCCFLFSCTKKEIKILVFTKTQTFRHQSIEAGVAAIFKLGRDNGITIDTTSDSEKFNEENLKQYSALLFMHSTGELFDAGQKNAFQRYIQAGGGWVGIHAASDAEYHWPWYNKLAGAYFMSHPNQQKAKLIVMDQTHESTKHLNKEWNRYDEWYDFKSLNPDVKVLIQIDETSYEGGKNGKIHPMAWYHEYDGGRAWYTGLGHTDESYQEEAFLQHVLGGIKWAIGKNKKNYKKVTTHLRPENDRFTLERLIQGQLFEPTEMTILPNKDVLIVQRRGEMMLYSESQKKITEVGKLDVYHQSKKKGVNVEEGLMGLTKDPEFAKNNYVYLFYAAMDKPVNRLSRFVFKDDSLHMTSELTVLEVESEREICCHTGGSVAFSGDGKYLFVSTGDNATPFDQPDQKYVNSGYAPQDDRPGFEQYDARRSSANTNDLRGKILRLKRNPDATFSIPEDNLFKPGNPKARQEIYVMGNRNPYRISVDKKNNYLYWGEVGPDAGTNSESRGPRGYDEINQAKVPGNFGWPLFVGNNYAYNRYDYDSGISGLKYDPAKPINESRVNTGLKDLPPAVPALIYYPYDKSDEFPMLGSGGRNAMAGPVYYEDLYQSKTKLPSYFNGKLLIYDWIRDWIKWVDVASDNVIEPFLEEYEFNNIIDIEMADDGQIYILEYGKGWFLKNSDSGLSRVNYSPANRVPRINNIKVDKKESVLPHTFRAVVHAFDPDKDVLTYTWFLNGEKFSSTDSVFSKSINSVSQSILKCEVSDASGNISTSETLVLNSGNDAPQINISVDGNQTFYFTDTPVRYSVDIKDDTEIISKNVMVSKEVSASWNKPGHAESSNGSFGENLMAISDCQSCHKKDTTSIGPSYVSIAERYAEDKNAVAYLSEKIRLGGSGKWGEVAMAAHPTISEEDAKMIVDWILSLAKPESTLNKSLPLVGSINAKPDVKDKNRNMLFLEASYTDLPDNKSKPILASAFIKLQYNEINANFLPKENGFSKKNVNNKEYCQLPPEGGSMELKNIDLFRIKNIILQIAGKKSDPKSTFDLQVVDKSTKKVVGTGIVRGTGNNIIAINTAQQGKKDYQLVVTPNDHRENELLIEKMVFLK
ncbi:MAG: ThuA domain-containing protein [Saprospiraceae bacterium]|nr:ThuA domain-containing protein [Saprospiraceae bacterium]